MKFLKVRRVLPLTLIAAAAFGATKHKQRLEDAATVLEEVMSTPDKAIPQNLLDKAHCVIIIPDLKKGAFIFGARYGKGYLTCRNSGGEGWSAPATVRVEGGSFGLQLGATETDVIMLVMNSRGADKLMASKFTVGGTAEAAAGPVGRTATAETDALMRAEILSYSRSRGLFAGVALQGATLREDLDANKALYKQRLTTKEIVRDPKVKPTPGGEKLLALLSRYSPKEAD
ncbi:MAG TPA: lipid-binding SYLF domain-containing protein [Bryobacteraceae bacterium]|nr:lipid-binding SYLF domain-containing protein [Bryobacteraceae bacterium]